MTATAISVRAPWWWAILYAGKRIENRPRPWQFRGRIYLHASRWWDAEEVLDTMELDIIPLGRDAGCEMPPVSLRSLRDLGGHIVGVMDIVDCVPNGSHPSDPWAVPGQYGLRLANVQPVAPPWKVRGQLGAFGIDVPETEVRR